MELTWLRHDVRRRWRSLLALAVLVALSAGFVLATAAGAVRGSTALDRLNALTRPATTAVLANTPGLDWDTVRALPSVESVAEFVLSGALIDYDPADVMDLTSMQAHSSWFPPVGDDAYDIDTPIAVEGRMLDPTAIDEVVVTPTWSARTGKGMGDTVRVSLYTADQIASIFAGGAPPAPAGPAFDATITGVVRSYWYSDDQAADAGAILLSPAVAETYPDEILGPGGGFPVNAIVRLHDGDAGMAAFAQELAALLGRSDIAMWPRAEAVSRTQAAVEFESLSLLALSAAAAVAASFLVGQAAARAAAASSTMLAPLRAIGMSHTQSVVTATLPVTAASITGVLGAAALAIAVSPLFPLGTAAGFEPAPGYAVQTPVIVGVALLVVAGLSIIAASAAALSARSASAVRRSSPLTQAATRSGLPVSVVSGIRFALEPGRGATATPSWPALLGAVVGVLGVVAALTFAEGLTDVRENPARFGGVYQVAAYAGDSATEYGDVDAGIDALLGDDRVAGVNRSAFAVADIGDQKTPLLTLDPRGDIPFTVTEGRMPDAPDEVALGPTSARTLRVGVGDLLEATGSVGSGSLTVVGIAFTPVSSHSAYDDAAFVTPAGFARLWDEQFKQLMVHIALTPGTEPASAADPLMEVFAAGAGAPVTALTVPVPVEVERLDRVGALPQILGVFLAVLAVAALAHTLATAVSRRRRDIAILRALGQTPGQAWLVSAVQATTIAIVGIVVGVPLGLAIGRTLWRVVADSTPVAYLDPATVAVVAGAALAAIVVANVVAAWPGRQAARMRVAQVLRTE